MYSLPIPIRCGGTGGGTGVYPVHTGDLDSMVLTGVSVGDGVRLGMVAGILRIGMEAIGLATGGPAIGDRDGITILIIRMLDGQDLRTIITTGVKVSATIIVPHLHRLTVGLLIIEDVQEVVWYREAGTVILQCWGMECV